MISWKRVGTIKILKNLPKESTLLWSWYSFHKAARQHVFKTTVALSTKCNRRKEIRNAMKLETLPVQVYTPFHTNSTSLD